MAKEFTCIVCPKSCKLKVEENGDGEILVSGFECLRGKKYGKDEYANPMRMLTSTVKIEGSIYNRLPVISKEEVPKNKLYECLAEIKEKVVKAPVTEGDIIIENSCNTGINIVASTSMDKV